MTPSVLTDQRRSWDALTNHSADLLLGCFAFLLTGLYGLLMLEDRVPTLGLAALGILWLAHFLLAGWRHHPTPLDAPILALMALMPLSLAISVDPSLTVPKVHGLLLGVGLYYTVLQFVRTRRRLALAVLALVLLGLAITVLGLVGTDWAETKLFQLPTLYEALPRLIPQVPRSRDGGIHFNVLSGALVFFIPLAASLLWDTGKLPFAALSRRPRLARGLWTALLVLALPLLAFTLLLTQSRGGYLGVFVALLALAVYKDRRYLLALPILAVVLLTIQQRYAQGSTETLLLLLDMSQGGTLPGRFEMWQRALLLIQDFPLTGVGLGAYEPVVNVVYPFFRMGPGMARVYHTHNMLLSIASELGLPALVLYVALLAAVAAMALRAGRESGPATRALLVGLMGGVLAHQVFGIMDAYMLGSKLGAVMWLFYGLVAAIFIHGMHPGAAVEPATLRFDWERLSTHLRAIGRQLVPSLGLWLLLAGLAAAWVNIVPLLSLALALLGGAYLGVRLVGE